MADDQTLEQLTIIISTAAVTFITGFALGIYSIRGYLISPAFAEERRKNLTAPAESDESDVDEDDSILDHAPNWANGADADRRAGLRARPQVAAASAGEAAAAVAVDPNEEYKLVLVVRTDLGMTKGKIAAQCSHATLACYKTLSRAAQKMPNSPEARILAQWERHGQAKIAVQAKSQEEIEELQARAMSLNITAETIHDAGRTQIQAGSLTVLGVGPAPKSLVDKVTSHLKLL